ncbi:MAG: hypothetical protein K8R23_10040 [Chthoniobacter sp.]|nr:hypothetical protein [Chthoniobacter sp.]
MPDDSPPVPVRLRWWRVLGWGLVVALVAVGGWSGWREYDYRAAVREARAAGFGFRESPTPLDAIREDWRAAFRRATWTEHRRELDLPEGTDLAPLRPLLVRLDPTALTAHRCRHLDAVRGLTRLWWLDIFCAEVNDLTPLAGLTQLQCLHLSGCPSLVDLGPLAALTQLQELRLRHCTDVKDLAPLAGLTQLQLLDLTHCTGVADLSPLAGLTQLQWLYLRGCTGLSTEAVAVFQKCQPETNVRGL